MKTFLFVSSTQKGKGFKLAVIAKNLAAARKYIKMESISVVAYRNLKYLSEGPPSDPENWCATMVKA